MIKRLISLLSVCLLLISIAPARAADGRDILLVYRSVGSWEYTDIIITLERDGSRMQFDVRALPGDLRNDLALLLAFLRTHGLDGETSAQEVPAPTGLPAVPADQAQAIADLLPLLTEQSFEPRFDKTDAGAQLLYAPYLGDDGDRLTLLQEDGSYIGQSGDPVAQQLIALGLPLMRGPAAPA